MCWLVKGSLLLYNQFNRTDINILRTIQWLILCSTFVVCRCHLCVLNQYYWYSEVYKQTKNFFFNFFFVLFVTTTKLLNKNRLPGLTVSYQVEFRTFHWKLYIVYSYILCSKQILPFYFLFIFYRFTERVLITIYCLFLLVWPMVKQSVQTVQLVQHSFNTCLILFDSD